VTIKVGAAFTVKLAVAVHPFELVYVIKEVPGETAVTRPVEVIEAIPGFEEIQGFAAGVVVAVNVAVVPTQADKLPDIVGELLIVTI
jgi:hypothetical protein